MQSNLPKEYLKSVLEQLGEADYLDYLESFNIKPSRWARCVSGKVTPDWFNGIASEIPRGLKVNLDPAWQAGTYYCQERSAMLPIDEFIAKFAQDKKFSCILDVCASPGGKSIQLMELLTPDGFLISNEIINSRCKVLMENLERTSAWKSSVTSLDIEKIGDKCPEAFDLILVDAPCSGEGMFRKDPDTIKQWSKDAIDLCVRRQIRILKNSLRCLSPGGYLIYSTCTLNVLENESVIEHILEIENLELVESVKIWPQKGLGEGHYYAFIRKLGAVNFSNFKPSKKKKNRIPDSLDELLSSIHKLSWMKSQGELIDHNDKWYWCSDRLPNLKYRRKGLELGEFRRGFKKSEFKFSQALALSLEDKDLDKSSIRSIELTDDLAKKYMRGEELQNVKDFKGYNLICYNGQGLGWVKANGSRLRNLFPQAWRIN